MTKCFVTFVLLVLFALENNRIFSRTGTSASNEADVSYYMRQQHRRIQHSSQHHQYQAPRLRHKRRHRLEHLEQHVSSEDDESAEALHRYAHLQWDMERQLQHQKQQRHHYKSMPQIWQNLHNSDDLMSDDDELGVGQLDPPVHLNHKSTEGNKQQLSTLRCPKCESNQQKVETISEEELTHLRIEYVKQQILEKLRLKQRPNVSAKGLPKPIYEDTTIGQENEQSKTKDLDDYYARTSKKFIFLEREKRECQRLGAHPSICFSFKIDDADADGFDVNTAVLWIYKNKQIKKTRVLNDVLQQQQTIVVSEVQQQLDSKYLPKIKPIAIQSVDVQDEWMKIDIEWPIKRWFGNHDLSHLIHISCQSCEIHSMDEMISVDKDYRPFIMVDTQNRRRVSRQKRSVNCTNGVTECCREKLYISFDEIGWGDWIIQPRGYDAYFCRGSCGSVASVTLSSSHHSSFLQKVVSSSRAGGKKPLELIPCCTAKQYSSLQLVFMDSNNTATLKTFPNMVVESCGCR